MSRCRIDHLVVTSPSLEAGAAFIRQALGTDMQFGGEHPRLGTHNLLLRLGDALYLEVIAPNPKGPEPERPRWFALDRLRPDTPPTLATWVVRTADIRTSASSCSEALGAIEPMRRGALRWFITLTADGSLPLGGVAPALIEWQTERHPAESLPDRGFSLAHLELFHSDPQRLSRLLTSLDLEGPVSAHPVSRGEEPHLVAHLDTPQGKRQLSGNFCAIL